MVHGIFYSLKCKLSFDLLNIIISLQYRNYGDCRMVLRSQTDVYLVIIRNLKALGGFFTWYGIPEQCTSEIGLGIFGLARKSLVYKALNRDPMVNKFKFSKFTLSSLVHKQQPIIYKRVTEVCVSVAIYKFEYVIIYFPRVTKVAVHRNDEITCKYSFGFSVFWLGVIVGVIILKKMVTILFDLLI